MPVLVGSGAERVELLQHGHAHSFPRSQRARNSLGGIDRRANRPVPPGFQPRLWRGFSNGRVEPALSRSAACRAARTKARIFSGSFSPGARSTPEDTSTPGARVIRKASATLPAIEAAREHERNAEIEILQQMPIEWPAEAARPRRVARRTRIEQDAVGDIGIRPDRREIGTGRDRNRLDHRQAKARADGADAFRRLAAMKLQQVGLQGINDVVQHVIGGVDRKRHLARAPADPRAEELRRLEADMPRRLGERIQNRPCRHRHRARHQPLRASTGHRF